MAAGPQSSSPGDLSTPPKSPSPAEAIVLTNKTSNGASAGTVAYPDLSGAAPSNGTAGGLKKDESTEKAPRKRRARASTADPKEDEDSPKPTKAPRRSRAPRKPKTESEATPPAPTNPATAAPVTANTSTPTPALKTATTSANMQPARPPSRQQKITDLVNHDTPVHYGNYSNTGSPSAHGSPYYSGNGDAQRPYIKSEQTSHTHLSSNSGDSPRSGQRYDPIRSSTVVDNQRSYPASTTPHQTSPIKSSYRASASPSISSLIDPPSASNPAYHYSTSAKPSPVPAHAQPAQQSNMLSNKPSPPSNSAKMKEPSAAVAPTNQQLEVVDPMDVDSVSGKPISRKPSVSNTAPPSKATSPKPPKKEKERVGTTPPLPPLPGSSIIASTLFGPAQAQSGDDNGTSIILHIPLNGETNKYVNFARLAEEKYGFAALHPRLAAQKERLARVAAAGAALENTGKGSGDEMSLDLSDGENELSNVDGGADKSGSAAVDTNGKKPRKKRRMKEDMYDKDDPFVDDTELAWEEMAAASKDGFFVYSGPLIPEGETARVERADGTIIKPPSGRGRGRGRGGGPGSRGGTSRTGGGPGSRGGQGGARRNRGSRRGGAAAASGEGRAKAASAGETGDAATATPSKTATTAPTHSSPLGQSVQVHVSASDVNTAAPKHDTAQPATAAA